MKFIVIKFYFTVVTVKYSALSISPSPIRRIIGPLHNRQCWPFTDAIHLQHIQSIRQSRRDFNARITSCAAFIDQQLLEQYQ